MVEARADTPVDIMEVVKAAIMVAVTTEEANITADTTVTAGDTTAAITMAIMDRIRGTTTTIVTRGPSRSRMCPRRRFTTPRLPFIIRQR